MRRCRWCPLLALAIASASCEAVVSLAHLDDGPAGAMDASGLARDAAVDGRTDADVDGPEFDGSAAAMMDAGDVDGIAAEGAVDGQTDAAGDCPLRGPTSVRIDTSRGAYCIDSTEVTNAHYAQFLSSIVPANATRPPGCERQITFTPHANWPFPPGKDTYPVVSVDWCQAYAYCAWAGKRLCGRIGGGSLAVGPPEKDPLQSQWFNACSDGGANDYPYGHNFDPAACGGQPGRATILPVETQTKCVGGYPGIHDMTGNVWEWVDVCDSNGPNALCRVYGGAFDSNQPELSCVFTGRASGRTAMGAANIGLRCCADL